MFKIIVIILIIGIIGSTIEAIRGFFVKKRISQKAKYDPVSVLQDLENAKQRLDPDNFSSYYEEQLLNIAERTGNVVAMVKLKEFYDQKSGKENEEKSIYWLKRAANMGDANSIMEYYGFSNYDVSSEDYNGMLQDLGKINITSEAISYLLDYHKGIVYYKAGQTGTARQLFISSSKSKDSGLVIKSYYMIALCFIMDSNIKAAINIFAYLEKTGFQIPAKGYLAMCAYYINNRVRNNPDYIGELSAFEKYSACTDADDNVVCQIGKSICYEVAELMYKGENGFSKDADKAIEMYERAAGFGSIEAAYHVGMLFMYTDYRDYYKANNYLCLAASNGSEQAAMVLKQYGVDNILIASQQKEKIAYRFMDGISLVVPVETIKCMDLYYGIEYKIKLLCDAFAEEYQKNFRSFDELINGVHQLYGTKLAEMLQWCVQLLMSVGIDTYDAEMILEVCGDLSLLPRVPLFEQAIEKIDERAAELSLQSEYANETRTYWTGAGFGTTIGSTIHAAVDSYIAAQAMNIGSGILQGIGNGIGKMIDNAEIKRMGKKVFENPGTLFEFKLAMTSGCTDIGLTVYNMIENYENIGVQQLEGSVLYGNEDLSYIDDRSLDAKINNNLSVGNTAYAYALLVEKLKRNPVDRATIRQLTDLTVNRSFTGSPAHKEIIRYTRNFTFSRMVGEEIMTIDR